MAPLQLLGLDISTDGQIQGQSLEGFGILDLVARQQPEVGGASADPITGNFTPVIFVPGFAGSFSKDTSDAGIQEWCLKRGVAPNELTYVRVRGQRGIAPRCWTAQETATKTFGMCSGSGRPPAGLHA